MSQIITNDRSIEGAIGLRPDKAKWATTVKQIIRLSRKKKIPEARLDIGKILYIPIIG